MDTTGDDAAARLALLARHFREHPVTGPSERRAPQATAGAPVNLSVVDHIDASVREVADYTRSVNTAAGPLPQHAEDVYAWCVDNTRHTPEAVQQRRDTIVFRQYLEHALRAGDASVVRPIRCPECRTLGLMWKAGRVMCTNRKCVDEEGMTRVWSLGRLAHAHISAQKYRQARAT